MATMINGIFPGELHATTTVAGCIDIFENAWPNPSRTIEMLESECAKPDSGAYWTKAGTFGGGARQNIRTNQLLPLTDLADLSNNGVLQNVHNQFYFLLLASSIPYVNKHNMTDGLYHEQYHVLKYSGGQEYKAHYDGATQHGRAVSALLYLNDDYEGGELEFPSYNVKIKPQAGMLILFPSNFAYNHVAHPVTKGTKYALVTWIKDRAE